MIGPFGSQSNICGMLAGPTGFDAAQGGVWAFDVDFFHLRNAPMLLDPGLRYPVCHVCAEDSLPELRCSRMLLGSHLFLRHHCKNHPLIPPRSSLGVSPAPEAQHVVVPGDISPAHGEEEESPH